MYTQGFNRRHQRVGHLFQGRFKAILVDREPYLLRTLSVSSSQSGARARGAASSGLGVEQLSGHGRRGSRAVLAQHRGILAQFGRTGSSARAGYRRFVAEGIAHPSHPWTEIRGQIYLGSDAFVAQAVARRTSHDSPDIPRAVTPDVPQHGRLSATDRAGVSGGNSGAAGADAATERGPGRWRCMRRAADAALGDVARRFGVSASGVSRRVTAVDARLTGDPRWQRRVAELFDLKYKT